MCEVITFPPMRAPIVGAENTFRFSKKGFMWLIQALVDGDGNC